MCATIRGSVLPADKNVNQNISDFTPLWNFYPSLKLAKVKK